jgi:aminopeptidase N
MTKESFQFLENYFYIPYPYKKYDQIFVPEFNFGAMENVACVTFTEHYIFRSKQLYSEYLSRSNTIFHEMVHMWFGNLVTMKWWNDIWLNESFADYLSYYAMSKGKLFPDAFEFQFSRKEWAYMQDQLSTTHPIVGSAEDTADAFSNFDGISYAKGASVLKQLTYYIGEDKFRDGIRLYLKKFYENNTVLEDFLMCMSETSGIDIVEWSKKWLETTGVNTLKFNPDKDQCYIEQMPSETNHKIRDHAIMYETYDKKDGKISIVESNKIIISSAKTDVNISSSSKFTLLNAQDHDYVKIHFRDEELNFIYNNLKNINDRFTQRIIWGNLWQMVRDNALSAIWFLNLVEKYSDIEMDSTVLQEQMLQKTMSIKSLKQ